MLIIRGTKKLRDRVKSPLATLTDTSTTELGDWFANAYFWRPQVVLLVNARTFLPVIMPLAPAATLLDRVPQAIASVLRRHGVDEGSITAELAAMDEVRIAPTNNPSVVRSMTDFADHGEFRFFQGMTDLDELSVALAGMPIGPLRDRTGFPDRELAVVFGFDRSNVIPFPASARSGAPDPAPDAPRRGHVPARSVFQLKVTLLDIEPPVWRRILVDGSATLFQLHEVIQAAFGWWNHHLHEFEVSSARYAVPDPDSDWDVGPPAGDERRTLLDEIAEVGSRFVYSYDFGDRWEHRIDVEGVLDPTAETTDTAVPACTGGRRACPPEDCGGPWGYRELLTILADPSHPEHRERVEWIEHMAQGPFDPDAFDPADFDDNLRNVRRAVFDD